MATLKDFAFATVMDIYGFVGTDKDNMSGFDASAETPTGNTFKLDSLTISNITQEGPVKEARGGINSMPIIRHKKTIRLEMEDVVAKLGTLEAFFGATVTQTVGSEAFTITDKFPTGIGLIGRTYVIDKETGERVWMQLTFNDFLPDGIFEINMEAEGDLGMISIAGELFPNECGEFFTAKKIASPADCA